MWNISDAIILSSIILTLGGLSITLSVINKKKGLTIFLIIFFILVLSFVFIFRDLVKEIVSAVNRSTYSKTVFEDKVIKLKNIKSSNPELKDIIYNFGQPTFFNDDSTLIAYFYFDEWRYNSYSIYLIEPNSNRTYLFKDFENTKKFNDNSADDLFNILNGKDIQNRLWIQKGAFFSIKNKKVKDCLIVGAEQQFLNNNINGWSIESINQNFGETEKEYYSIDFMMKAYKVENVYIYYINAKYHAIAISFDDDYNINSYPFIDLFYNNNFKENNNK